MSTAGRSTTPNAPSSTSAAIGLAMTSDIEFGRRATRSSIDSRWPASWIKTSFACTVGSPVPCRWIPRASRTSSTCRRSPESTHPTSMRTTPASRSHPTASGAIRPPKTKNGIPSIRKPGSENRCAEAAPSASAARQSRTSCSSRASRTSCAPTRPMRRVLPSARAPASSRSFRRPRITIRARRPWPDASWSTARSCKSSTAVQRTKTSTSIDGIP
mmetsp:Transcript_10085/g.28716  ORF Transcript_10085/g.28716 Transcript_10085/m.28716 type:complete len:216 (+) Transcript_10085:928-1575(+)